MSGFAPHQPPNPVLLEVWRGDEIESAHRGAACIVDARGRVMASWGDIARPIFARSAVKLIQALPLIESGAANGCLLTDAEIALACASHGGEPGHVAVVARWLDRLGISCGELECGHHVPFCEQASLDLAASRQGPTALHNNCSGKHAGFLTIARHLGITPEGYFQKSHPIQPRVTQALADMLEFDLAAAACGIDGCGIPTYAVPLRGLAQAMAKFADPETLPRPRADATQRITQAVVANPWLVAGTGRFDTAAMSAGAGNLVVKMGAEGVHVAIVRNAGLGIALKIDDGGRRAADGVMAAILRARGYLVANSEALLAAATIRNNRGETVGEIRTPFVGGPKSTLSGCTIRDIKHET